MRWQRKPVKAWERGVSVTQIGKVEQLAKDYSL